MGDAAGTEASMLSHTLCSTDPLRPPPILQLSRHVDQPIHRECACMTVKSVLPNLVNKLRNKKVCAPTVSKSSQS